MGIMRALTLANRERGKDSLGFFGSNNTVWKSEGDPIDVLAKGECSAYLNRVAQTSWAVCGHTRFMTRGAVCDKNSHPFQYGSVIGAHNGCCDAPYEYTVDSEYLIDCLSKGEPGGYQAALQGEWGYWTLAWYEERTKEFFISMYDNTCGMCEVNGVHYFSSDPDHLLACTGCKEVTVFDNGDVAKFNCNGFVDWMPKYKSEYKTKFVRDYRTSGTSYYTSSRGWPDGDDQVTSQRSGGSVQVNDPEGFMRDYDAEFRKIWGEYIGQYDAPGVEA